MQVFRIYECLNVCLAHSSGLIAFVADQNYDSGLVGVALHFIYPVVLDGVERVDVVEIEDQIDSMGICISDKILL